MNVYLYPMLSQLLKKHIHETYIFRPFFGSCLDSWCFCFRGKMAPFDKRAGDTPDATLR